MKKEPKILHLAVVDLAPRAITASILSALKWAALARGRRVCRSATALKVATLGYPPNPDTWRHVAARYLRRRLPWAVVHVGGHHVAVHDGMGTRAGDYGQCLARVVETANA